VNDAQDLDALGDDAIENRVRVARKQITADARPVLRPAEWSLDEDPEGRFESGGENHGCVGIIAAIPRGGGGRLPTGTR